MPLFPEQARALAYAKKRGTDATLDSIRTRVAATYAEFEALVADVPASVAREHRGSSAWSIQEVVDHLLESERPAVRQLAQLLAGESVSAPIPASLQSQRPLEHDWATLQSQFRTGHVNILDLLTKASDALPLAATAAVQMVVKCAGADGAMTPISWIEHFDWKAYAILLHAHNREHIAQVHRILNLPIHTGSWLIYGANGYTGELAAREAVRRGHRPLLGGRRREALEPLARELGLECRIFGLDDPAAAAAGLRGMRAVLHCAGPFVRTSAPMVEACLAAGTDYLDITGEIAVFEAAMARDAEARRCGRVLLPGVGFDVVPSDCLAASLAAALPGAVELVLAFIVAGGGFSAGTLKTMIEALPYSGAIRKQGRIVPVPLAWDSRKIPFGCGSRWAMTIAWGDVSTAFHSTGIPNIRVYTGMPPGRIRWLRRLRPFLPLLGLGVVKRTLQAWVGRRVQGPDQRMREQGRTYLWGEVRDDQGGSVARTMELGEGYAFTAVSAVSCLERVLAGTVLPGSSTPSRALGAEFVTTLPGVTLGEFQRSGPVLSGGS